MKDLIPAAQINLATLFLLLLLAVMFTGIMRELAKVKALLKNKSACCGAPLKGRPIRAIGVGDQTYYVYRCPVCLQETLSLSQVDPE
jgi:hypothetical protein